ncbi:DUF5753 domain-containing protein [Actinomadura harenae]|uniref:DUF5753 domain-containing protein n=1 Tax=Actinomadura harenae TaxID=2483351 RepID=UPI0011C44AD7|nr:DUF5753 domain-containing protein [Actinomadura harenae]
MLDPSRSLWDLIAVELERQIYEKSTSQAGVAKILGCDRSTVTRVLSGVRRMAPEHAATLDTAWNLRGLLGHLVAHALARPDEDYMPAFAEYEARATRIRSWGTAFIPGLWQTPEYARATLEAAWSAGLLDDVDKALATRLDRQKRVWGSDDPPRITAIIAWTVLRTQAGGNDVMAAALAHMLELAQRPGVSVRIVPEEAGLHVGHDGPFQLLTVGSDVAFTDAPGTIGHLFLEPSRVEQYARRMERISDIAWTAGESVAAIEQGMGRYA